MNEGLPSRHSDNIAGAISLLKNVTSDTVIYLNSIKLLIFDEAQDLVGNRAILAVSISNIFDDL